MWQITETITNPDLFSSEPTTIPNFKEARIRSVLDGYDTPNYMEIHAGVTRPAAYPVFCDPEFPIRSQYAAELLSGSHLNSTISGSYLMRRNQIIKIAAKHGLLIVKYMGQKYWSDDVRLPEIPGLITCQ